MSSATLSNERFRPRESVTTATYPEQSSDVSHDEPDMTKATDDEQLRQLLIASLTQSITPKGKLNGWAAPILTGAAVFIGLFGLKYIPAGEVNLQTQLNDVKVQASEALREAKKANLNNALLDTYNRELERALIKKGVPLPSYPVLEK